MPPPRSSMFRSGDRPFLASLPAKTADPRNKSPLPPEERSTIEPNPKRPRMAPSTSESVAAAFHFDKGDSVTLIVGPERHELLVHANYIARNSEFFEAALRKEWREGRIRTISMPADDYETMTTYLRFVYGAQLPSKMDLPSSSICRTPTADELEGSQSAYTSFTKLYILGCRLMDKTFQEAAIAKMLDTFHACYSCFHYESLFNPGPISVNKIYEETLETDPVRRLLVDMHMKHPQDLSSEYNPGFLLDVAQVFSKKARSSPVRGTKLLELRNFISIP